MTRPKARSRVPDGSRRVKEILDSAASLFLEKGYARTSTTAIAARARASKHTLYEHFPSKQDLFAAVVTSQMDVVVREFSTLMHPEASPRETLINLGKAVIHLVSQPQHMATAHIAQAEFQSFPEMSRTFYRLTTHRTVEQMARYLREQARRGALRVTDPEIAAEQICNLMFGGVCQRLLMGVHIHSKRQELDRIESHVDLFLRGIQ